MSLATLLLILAAVVDWGAAHGVSSRHGTVTRGGRQWSMNSLADRVKQAVQVKFSSQGDISRVLGCWDSFTAGKKLHRYVDAPTNKVLQTAECFVDSLSAIPFHDVSKFPWIQGMEDNYKTILDELTEYEYKRRKMTIQPEVGLQLPPTGVGQQGDGEWLGPRDESGTHYGPEWKTLGIQDRSVWDPEITLEFPRTVDIMKQHNVPSCEVFFAKQGPRSGLKPHSDKNNFIITCHLALDVPEGQCWVQCGDTVHYWKNGKTCIFDTSIIHSTENTSDRTRYVLLVRFWHPELTQLEASAFKFIFDFLDHAGMGDEALEQFEMQQLFMGKDQHHKGLQKTTSTSEVGSRGVAPKAVAQGKTPGLFSSIERGGMGVERTGNQFGKGGKAGKGKAGGMRSEMDEARAPPRPSKGFGAK